MATDLLHALPTDVAPQPTETYGPLLVIALVVVAAVAVGVAVIRLRRKR